MCLILSILLAESFGSYDHVREGSKIRDCHPIVTTTRTKRDKMSELQEIETRAI